MSLALSRLILFSVFVISSRVMCRSWKGGCALRGAAGTCGGGSCFGMVLLVLCPIVMKWSLRALAIAVGSV